MIISLINTIRAIAVDRFLSAIILFGILFYAILTLFVVYTNRPFDYYINVIASRILSTNINIYEMNATDYQVLSQQMADSMDIQIKILPHFLYLYPTLTALMVYPLSFLPIKVNAMIWIFLSGVASIFSGLILCTYTTDIIKQRIIMVFMICFVPIWATMSLGQINVFILLSTLWFLYWMRLKKNIAAGIMLAFSIFMKPFVLGVLPLLLWRKKFVTFGGFLIGTAFITFFSITIFGASTTISQFTNVVKIATPSGLYHVSTVHNLNALFGRLTSDASMTGFVLYILTGGLVGGLTMSTILLRPGRDDFEREAALLIAATLMINPLTWYHHLTMFSLVFGFIILSCKDFNWILIDQEISTGSVLTRIQTYLSSISYHNHFRLSVLMLTGILLTNLHGFLWKYLSGPLLLLSSFPVLTTLLMWGVLLMQVRHEFEFSEN